jgi:hypothetical protein
LAIRILIANYQLPRTRRCCNFKGLSQAKGRVKFAENLRATYPSIKTFRTRPL